VASAICMYVSLSPLSSVGIIMGEV